MKYGHIIKRASSAARDGPEVSLRHLLKPVSDLPSLFHIVVFLFMGISGLRAGVFMYLSICSIVAIGNVLVKSKEINDRKKKIEFCMPTIFLLGILSILVIFTMYQKSQMDAFDQYHSKNDGLLQYE